MIYEKYFGFSAQWPPHIPRVIFLLYKASELMFGFTPQCVIQILAVGELDSGDWKLYMFLQNQI